MRYTITSSQHSFFEEEGEIEFENLLNPQETESLSSLVALSHQIHPSGRDLERGNPALFRAMQLNRLGQIALQLTKVKPLRLGFTQLYPPFHVSTLKEASSVSELVAGALIDLSEGNVVFFKPNHEIDFSGFLLIAFAKITARYVLQPNDPHTHMLKQLGYGTGDRLLDETHPLIAR